MMTIPWSLVSAGSVFGKGRSSRDVERCKFASAGKSCRVDRRGHDRTLFRQNLDDGVDHVPHVDLGSDVIDRADGAGIPRSRGSDTSDKHVSCSFGVTDHQNTADMCGMAGEALSDSGEFISPAGWTLNLPGQYARGFLRWLQERRRRPQRIGDHAGGGPQRAGETPRTGSEVGIVHENATVSSWKTAARPPGMRMIGRSCDCARPERSV